MQRAPDEGRGRREHGADSCQDLLPVSGHTPFCRNDCVLSPDTRFLPQRLLSFSGHTFFAATSRSRWCGPGRLGGEVVSQTKLRGFCCSWLNVLLLMINVMYVYLCYCGSFICYCLLVHYHYYHHYHDYV